MYINKKKIRMALLVYCRLLPHKSNVQWVGKFVGITCLGLTRMYAGDKGGGGGGAINGGVVIWVSLFCRLWLSSLCDCCIICRTRSVSKALVTAISSSCTLISANSFRIVRIVLFCMRLWVCSSWFSSSTSLILARRDSFSLIIS